MGKINSKKKGNAYEQKLASIFREKGWEKCLTSREESKRMDDIGVDLCHTEPFYVQAKAWERAPGYHEVLSSMPSHPGFNLLFHKRNRKGSVVVMTDTDFFRILQLLIDNNLVIPNA